MASESISPAEYIGHHLTFFTRPVGEGTEAAQAAPYDFWVVNVDSVIVATLLGIVGLGFFWWVARGATAGVPGKRQAFVELCFRFIDNQVKDIFHGDRHKFVAPFALALSVFGLMIFYSIKIKGLGGWIHELFCAPFGANPLLWPFNLLFNLVEYVSKPLSHSLRLFGNMYAGEIIFLLLGMWAATGIVGAVAGAVLHLGWSIFHILIVALQAYIFMMLTVVYIAMAHEHH
jgi:F-type H+-transporting ATPase subunit a